MASTPTRQRIPGYYTVASRRCPSEKVSFPTYWLALEAAEMLMDMGRVDPGCHQTPYQCRDCGDWHVGNRRIYFRIDPDEVA